MMSKKERELGDGLRSTGSAFAKDKGGSNDEASCAGSLFVKGLGLVLMQMAQAALITNGPTRQEAMLFRSSHAPSMSIQDYLDRIRIKDCIINCPAVLL